MIIYAEKKIYFLRNNIGFKRIKGEKEKKESKNKFFIFPS